LRTRKKGKGREKQEGICRGKKLVVLPLKKQEKVDVPKRRPGDDIIEREKEREKRGGVVRGKKKYVCRKREKGKYGGGSRDKKGCPDGGTTASQEKKIKLKKNVNRKLGTFPSPERARKRGAKKKIPKKKNPVETGTNRAWKRDHPI